MALTQAERNFINRSVATIGELKALEVVPRRSGCIATLSAGDLPVFYLWTPTSVVAPDGVFYVNPNSITPPAPGRWISNLATAEMNTAEVVGLLKLFARPDITDVMQGSANNDKLATWGAIIEHPGVSSQPEKDILTVTSNGQTAFPGALSFTPSTDKALGAFLNGVGYLEFGVDYTFSGQDFTWLDPNSTTLSIGQKIFVWYNHIGSGSAVKNVTEEGIIFNGYNNANNWISNNINGNYVQYVDNTQPAEPVLITGTVKSIPPGSTIDPATDIMVNTKMPLRSGIASPVRGTNIPQYKIPTFVINTLTRSGSTATVDFIVGGADIRNHKKIGQYVWIANAVETEYNGVHLITGLPSASEIEYAVSGTPATPATGALFGRLTYTPSPEHNGWAIENSGTELYVFQPSTDLVNGFHQTLTQTALQQFKTYIPTPQFVYGVQEIGGGSSYTARAWQNVDAQHPLPGYRYASVRVRRLGTNEWILEFDRVHETAKVA